MKIIAIVNRKGGVGKTTLTMTWAAHLAQQGQRVLIVDTDTQADLSMYATGEPGNGLVNALLYGRSWVESAVTVSPGMYAADPANIRGRIDIVRADAGVNAVGERLRDNLALLRARLTELEDKIDTVLIDTAPSVTHMQLVAMYAADAVVVPVGAGIAEINGADTIRSECLTVGAQRGFALPLLAVVPVQFRANVTLYEYALGYINEMFPGLVTPTLGERSVWREARARTQTLYAYVAAQGANPKAMSEAQSVMDTLTKRLESVSHA